MPAIATRRFVRLLWVGSLLAVCTVFGEQPALTAQAADKPHAAQQSLPGLLPAPRELPGGFRWQILTIRARATMDCFDLTADGQWCVFADEAVVRVYKTKGFELAHVLVGHRGKVRAVAWSADGTMIATASADGTARIWKSDGTPLVELSGHTGEVKGIAWSRDGKLLATCGQDATVRLWHVDGSPGPVARGADAPVLCVAFSPDGTRIASGDDDRDVRIWKTDGTLVAKCSGHHGPISSLDWSPNGKLLVSSCLGYMPQDGKGGAIATIRIWDADGQFVRALDGHTGPIHSVRFSPDGSKIASSSSDFSTREWSVDGQLLASMSAEKDDVLRWMPDGKHIYVACSRRIYLVDPIADQAGALDEEALNARARATGLVIDRVLWFQRAIWNPAGKTFATLGFDSRLRMFDANGHPLWSFDAKRDLRFDMDLAWRPDGKELIVTGMSQESPIVNDAGKQVRQLATTFQPVRLVQWSPDGKSILGSDFSQAYLMGVNGELEQTFSRQRGRIESIAWNPNGKQFASSGTDAMLRIWSVDGKTSKAMEGNAGDIDSVAWSPDGKLIATGVDDGGWRFWKADGTEGPIYNGNGDSVMGIAFSPDGKRIATAGWNGTVRIAKVDGGEVIREFDEHAAPVMNVSWSPDGKRLISSSRDNTARIWNTETHQCEMLVLSMTDGTTATFSAAGDLIDGKPESLAKDLRCMIQRPNGPVNGPVELVTWQQFQELAKQAATK